MARKIGIVGGLGWRATASYYAAVHELAGKAFPAGADPDAAETLELVIESLDQAVASSLLEDGERDRRWEGFDNYHRAALLRLERAEAEVALIACNTPHERLPAITRGTRLELIDLFEQVAAEANRHGAERLLVLGTPTTMNSQRFRRLLASSGIELIMPEAPAALMLKRLIRDLQETIADDAFERLLEIVRGSLHCCRDAVIGLNCTELPLIFPGGRLTSMIDCDGMRFLNASAIHVEAALRVAGHPLVADETTDVGA